MAVNIYGLIGILIFYAAILLIGIWAARRGKRTQKRVAREKAMLSGEDAAVSEAGKLVSLQEEVMLAGRNIGPLVGIFTMTATWVGGGYINGTAEHVIKDGIINTQAAVAYSLSIFIGGMFFAKQMRSQGYITLLDPFQKKYGNRIGGLLYIPLLLGELLWSAAILAALGASVSVVLDLERISSILVSAAIAVSYTLIGGLWSVAYTDVLQLICIFVGLWLTIPFAWQHPAVGDISSNSETWLGHIPEKKTAIYVDNFLLLTLGGVPWQAYFQRVLSAKDTQTARTLSFVASIGIGAMAIPPMIIGCIAASTDWNQTEYARGNLTGHEDIVLPLVLQYLTPTWVSVIGLGAVSAAVMSSSDSSVLGASSMFARNVYQLVFRQNASAREIRWVIRCSIVGCGCLAAVIAITVDSIYALWYLCSDLVYVVMFPQLVLVIYLPQTNGYGSLAGYLVGVLLRVLGGEKKINFRPVLYYPHYDPDIGQLFPYKTFAMIVSFLTIVLVSLLTNYLFQREILPERYDVCDCLRRKWLAPGLDIHYDVDGDGDEKNEKPPIGERSGMRDNWLAVATNDDRNANNQQVSHL